MADALATLAAHRPEPADRRPATDFAPPRSTAPMAPDGVRVRVPPGPIALAAAALRAGEATSGGLVDEALLAVD